MGSLGGVLRQWGWSWDVKIEYIIASWGTFQRVGLALSIITSTLSSSKFSYFLAMPPAHSHQDASSFNGLCRVAPFRFCAIDLFWSSRGQYPPAVRLGSTRIWPSESDLCPASYPVTVFSFPLTLPIWWDFYGKKKHQPAVGTSVYLLIWAPFPKHLDFIVSFPLHPSDIRA